MKTVPYLNFDGQCEAAFQFYAELLGGKVEAMTYGESPIADEMPAEAQHLIMHAYLATGDAELMGSDAPPGQYERPQGMFVALNLEDVDAGERIFKALSEGGKVFMKWEATFWAKGFGMAVDRFGTRWIVNGGPIT